MLQSLNIKNFILIDQLELDFHSGFNVITGETGAGKSIILDSILFALGGKLSRDVAKDEEKPSAVSCTFIINSKQIIEFLQENDIEFENHEIIVKRSHTSSGRSKHYINGELVNRKQVQLLFDLLLEMHGQHSHTALLDPDAHMPVIDEFARNSQLCEELADIFLRLRGLKNSIDKYKKNAQAIENEIEYLDHCIEELKSAAIAEGEYTHLSDMKLSLQNRDKELTQIREIISNVESLDVENNIPQAQRNIARSSLANSFTSEEQLLEEIYDKVEILRCELQGKLSELENDDMTLEEIAERLQQIKDLARKHNCQPEELVDFQKKSEVKLEGLRDSTDSCAEEEKEYAELLVKYHKKAVQLSNSRVQAAEELEGKVHDELSRLDMKRAKFKVDIVQNSEKIAENGIDQVRFMATTNPGKPFAPLDKVASGGELSRFMLGMRAALQRDSNARTIIFDEIDVGISGAVADSIGERLLDLGNKAQVIVITHQPQVAGKSDTHILVSKTHQKESTEVKAEVITDEVKSRELARMISGRKITDAGIKAASELITN